jgi:hypothetical protein
MESRTYEPDDLQGEALVREILEQMEEDERLSRLVGVDLSPPGPDPSHAPRVIPNLADWLRRSEEVHAFLASKR